MTKMKIKVSLFLLLLNSFMVVNLFAQVTPPLVYDVENTGANYSIPDMPTLSKLPVIEPLTDPFEWSDRSGRDTTFASWSHRRAEIGAEIEHYEIGPKPDRPDTITASYSGGKLTVKVTKNGQTLTLTSTITLPSGTGPFPAIIGMNSGSGSLPADIFSTRKIATIAFIHDQVVTYNAKNKSDPYFKLYPDLYYSGEYAPWIWGISRIIDGLELVKDVLPIDLKHLAVTGCSYAGKMALFAGAFDERIALTIAEESGGGGAAAWRVSQNLGAVENIGATSHQWFMESMFQFSGSKVFQLPEDHHELMAMVAPRALLCLGNPDYVWLADESGYVSCKAAQRVWKTFGIEDRMGFTIVGGHMHCALPDSEKPEVEAFVDKFLLGDTTVNTNISTNPYENVDYAAWTNWWGTGNPVYPKRDIDGTTESVWLEAECATVGKYWDIKKSVAASNDAYATIKAGQNSTSVAPTDSSNVIYFPFSVTKDTTYYIFGRVYCNTNNDDSFWLKLDDGSFEKLDGLSATGWLWKKFSSANLKAGNHIITIAYCEDGAYLDKLCISSERFAPIGKGETAANACVPKYTPKRVGISSLNNGFSLGQNYPNPVNDITTIEFEIPYNTYVSLKVYNILGVEIKELAGKEFSQGKYSVDFNSKNLSKGIYFYTMKADNFSKTEKMELQR
jgi:hypothetical protein